MPFRIPTISFKRSAADLWLGHATSPSQRGLAVIVCATAVGALAWVGVDWHARNKALADEHERVMSAQARFTARKPLVKPSSRALSSIEIARHNTAVSQLNTPWSDVFNGLERQAQADVGLTVLEPDTKKGALRVQAEAKDIDRLLVYAEQLALDPAFGKLNFQQHETNEQDPNRPARLSFEVRLSNATTIAEASK